LIFNGTALHNMKRTY